MSEAEGKATVEAFIDAFNAQDHERLAATLNYPHIRLTNTFTRVENADEFIARSRAGAPHLRDEGWDHTEIGAINPIQVGEDKVHLMLTMNRCRADGSVYNAFETLWIATLVDGHWGIQFRSSYLAPR